MKNSFLLQITGLLFTFTTPVFAMCIDDIADMKIEPIELTTPEAVQIFVAADTKVTELKARPGDEHKLAGVRLKDASCIVKAIQSFDSTKYRVLAVDPFVSGRSDSVSGFSPTKKKLSLRLEVGDRNTPLKQQISTKIKYYVSGYPYNGSGLHSTSEFIDCDIE